MFDACVLGVDPGVARLGLAVLAQRDRKVTLVWSGTVQTASDLDVSVVCTPARHFSGRAPWNRNRTLWCGWILRAHGLSVFFAGDTALHPEFGALLDEGIRARLRRRGARSTQDKRGRKARQCRFSDHVASLSPRRLTRVGLLPACLWCRSSW
jgi:hypothetical protein